MAHDVKIHHAHPPASIGLGKESILMVLFILWLFTHPWNYQVGAPPNPTIYTTYNDAFTTVLDALQIRRSLNVIIPPSYLDLFSSFAICHPPFNNNWMTMKLEETLMTHHAFQYLSNPWMVGRLREIPLSVGSEIAHRRLGAKSFMNCLNESAGSEKWSIRFLLFYFSIISYAQYLQESGHSPSLFSGVVRIRGTCWMPLLMNYVGVLMRFISTPYGIRYI